MNPFENSASLLTSDEPSNTRGRPVRERHGSTKMVTGSLFDGLTGLATPIRD